MRKLTLHIIQEKECRRFVVTNNAGKMFIITEVLYIILDLKHRQALSDQAIANYLNSTYLTYNYTATEIDEIIAEAMKRITDHPVPGKKRRSSSYIYFRFPLLSKRQLPIICNPLRGLFACKVLLGLSVLSTVICLVFFYNEGEVSALLHPEQKLAKMTIFNLVISYFSFLLIILIHEIGHASAVLASGMEPKEIGFGIYLIFPVLYTDVSETWALESGKRTVIDFAGIYFQLLVNLILIAGYHLFSHHPLVFILICANTTSLVCSLNPFFRYDGYWLYSDYFGLHNLKKRSWELLKIIAYRRSPVRLHPRPLVCYAFLNLFFWISLYMKVVLLIIY